MDNEASNNLDVLLSEKIRAHGLTLKKLSELSGIAVKHLENLAAGRFDDLPPPPYLRGYILKLGAILGFDGEEWWEKLREQHLPRTSGEGDKLPKNRFALAPTWHNIWIFVFVVLLVLYVGVRFSKILGRPSLTIFSPIEETVRAPIDRFTLRGKIENGTSVHINGERVPIDGAGQWQKEVPLEPGLNSFEIKGGKFLGRETKLTRQIFYEPQATTPPPTPNEE